MLRTANRDGGTSGLELPSRGFSPNIAKTVLRYLTPFIDPDVGAWALEARLLRWLTLLWLAVGLIVLFSASYPIANAEFGDGLHYFKRQLIWALIGLIGFNTLTRTPLRRLHAIAPFAIFLLIGLILSTKVPGLGTNINGAERWVKLGPFLMQPSELIKPFLVLQSAYIFGCWQRLSWPMRLLWLGVFALVLGGILIQPNLSNTALCGMTLWLVALAAGLPLLGLGGVALGGIALATISISIHDYQRRRVMSFLDPFADPKGDGYQLIQSLLAIGSGETWGTGFGLSQQKLFYLPIQYTDFIFAVYAEEFGFVGSIALLCLILTYATVAAIIAAGARHLVQRLVAVGATIFLVGQSLINIGVATGALPTTGLPLPFFSYGGNSLIASLILAGLIVRVARESKEAEIVPFSRRHHLKKERDRPVALK